MLKKLLFAAIVLILLVIAAIGGTYGFYKFQMQSSAVAFQQYEPTNLPAGITITSRTIEIWENQRNKLAPSKMIRMDTSDPNFSIAEERIPGGIMPCADNQECQHLKTAKGQSYELRTSITYDPISNAQVPFNQTAYFAIGSTWIWIDSTSAPAKTYTVDEWDTLIDSFVPSSYDNLPTKYYVPGP